MTTIATIAWRSIRKFILFVALLNAGAFTFTTNAIAQDNIVEECLATEAEKEGMACIGRQADACLEKSEGLSTHGQVECIDRELVLWDKILNREYLMLRAALDDEQKARLKEAQRTWIRLRDQDCTLPHVFFRGTMAQPMGAYCSMKRTAQRALFLRMWRETMARQ